MRHSLPKADPNKPPQRICRKNEFYPIEHSYTIATAGEKVRATPTGDFEAGPVSYTRVYKSGFKYNTELPDPPQIISGAGCKKKRKKKKQKSGGVVPSARNREIWP